jgi:nucleotide-binding universal stress UspA family protein
MRVLVATDGSPSSGIAVDLVAGIHWPAGSVIRLVEAIDAPPVPVEGPWPAISLVEREERSKALWRQAVDMLDAAGARIDRSGSEVSIEVLRGRAASAIVDAAERFGADVIVLGSRGRGTIESMILGSVSSEVVDHAAVPVLVARTRSIDPVILAWDGSSCARVAVDVIKAWRIFESACVRVVSVADIGTPWWTGFATGAEALVEEGAVANRRVHAEFARDVADELLSAGLDAVGECREGDPATQLILAAADDDAKLIVLGTHGRTALERLLMGSVARNVLHHARCSVLVARTPSRRVDT